MSDVEKYQDEKESFLQLMEDLRPDLFIKEEWSAEKKAIAANIVKSANTKTTMFASIPLKCHGPKCPFAAVCPLQQEGIAPISKPCPIEMNMVRTFMSEYMQDLGIDSDNLIEVSMIRDLINEEIMQQRATWTLSMEHFIQDNVVGIDGDGKPIMRKELHLAVEMKDKIARHKKDIRNQLLATREARAKAGQGILDTAQNVSNILEQLNEIDRKKQELLNKKLGIYKKDEYIEGEVVEDEDE